MPWYNFVWNDEPGGNVEHIGEHGISPQEVESVVSDPLEEKQSRSSGNPIAIGYASDGRLILVVFEKLDDHTIYPITAYELGE